jgi:cell division GTPase FtsZ
VIAGFGRSTPRGSLPVFSTTTEKEARTLLVMTCPTNYRGEFIAPELAEQQTIDNLQRFSDRLANAHDRLAETGNCECDSAHIKKQ